MVLSNGRNHWPFVFNADNPTNQGCSCRCNPYKDDIDVKNLTLDDTKNLDVFPEGIYKFSWITYNKTLDIVWRFNVSVQIKSPIKESMG